MSDDNPTIVELRQKLESRSWFLRASLALNIALVGSIVSFILNKVA